jgi:hypothetical protein
LLVAPINTSHTGRQKWPIRAWNTSSWSTMYLRRWLPASLRIALFVRRRQTDPRNNACPMCQGACHGYSCVPWVRVFFVWHFGELLYDIVWLRLRCMTLHFL